MTGPWTWNEGSHTGGVIKLNGVVQFGLVQADVSEGPKIVAVLNDYARRALGQAAS